jgi:protein-L-isoaspartate O-methyltransferase
MMAESFPGADIVALDEDRVLVEGVKRMALSMGIKSIKTTVADLNSFSPDRKFNLICCVDVMEHIPDHGRIFDKFSEWLESGGTLILHVPQKNQKFLFIKRTHGGDDPHCREGYDLPELTGLLESRGLMITYHKHTFAFAAALAVEMDEIFWKSRLYPVWLAAYPFLLTVAVWDLWHPGNQGQGMLVVARKNG